jgi:Tol biopolymer transport system component
MSLRISAPRTVLAAVASGLAAACADQAPTAPAIRDTPSADIVVGPGLPCTTCPNPNAGKILFVRNANARGVLNQEVFKADADGANAVRLTFTPEDESEPAWSADYARIVFVRKTAGNSDLYVMNADGSKVKQATKTSTVYETQPTWTPDGGLVFVADLRHSATYKGFPQLSYMAPKQVGEPNGYYGSWLPHLPNSDVLETCDRTGPCFPLDHPSPVQHPHMSPNGRDIAFLVYNPKAGRMGIRVIDVYSAYAPRWLYGTELVLPSPNGPAIPMHPRFSPEGAQLSILLGSDVLLLNAGDGTVEHKITPGKPLSSVSWSPDGTALLARNDMDGSLLRIDRSSGAVLPLANTATTFYPNWAR